MRTEVRETKGYRPGFRSIGPTLATMAESIRRLAKDGHLGQRKCQIQKNRAGRYACLVYKAGRTKRVFQGNGVGARLTKNLGPKNPQRAWLEVPGDEIAAALSLVGFAEANAL